MTKWTKRIVSGIVIAIAFLFCAAFAMAIFPKIRPILEVVKLMIIGWRSYFVRAMSSAHLEWGPAARAGVYAIAMIVGAHYFVRWVFREVNRNADTEHSSVAWRWSWTLRCFALLFLACFAGMATIGIAHQAAWLATSRKPLIHELPRERAAQCASNLRTIGQALVAYAAKNGNRYPDGLGELMNPTFGVPPESFICPHSPDKPATGNTPDTLAQSLRQPGHCSYLYFGKGHTPGDANAVIALEPPANHEDAGIMVLFGDGHVDWIEIDQADDVLRKHGFERAEPLHDAHVPAKDVNP